MGCYIDRIALKLDSAAEVFVKFQNEWKSKPESRLRDFTRSCANTSARFVNKGYGLISQTSKNVHRFQILNIDISNRDWCVSLGFYTNLCWFVQWFLKSFGPNENI